MRRLQISILLLIVGFATGCPKPRYRPTVNFDQGMVDKFNAALKRQYRSYECYRFGPTHTDFQGNACTGFTEDQDKARAVRNELIENALPYIDESYMSFVSDLQADRDRNNFVLDLVELGTAASVGITKGERPLQIIGVALTAFRGGRRSIDANFYKDTSVPILISKMDGNRAKVRATILERETQNAADYPLGAAVSDIVDYFNAGTLVRAFTQLQQDTAVITQQSEAHLTNLKEAGVKGAPRAEEIEASKKISEAFSGLWEAYRDAHNSVNAEDAKITAAVQAINEGDTAIATADLKIGDADARIANAANKPAKTQAEIDKSKAEADKAKAEANKMKAEAEKAAAETAKAAAVGARDEAFSNLKGTYEAIAADNKLSPLLDEVPNDPDFDPAFKASLEARLKRRKENNPIETDNARHEAARDYATILLQFGGMVAEKVTADPTLINRLQEILKANK